MKCGAPAPEGVASTCSCWARVRFRGVGCRGLTLTLTLTLTPLPQLFPTACRSSAVGVVCQSGDLGGVVAPQLLLLGRWLRWQHLPFLIMGLASALGALGMTLLPETHGLPQSDTVEGEGNVAL